MSMALEFLHDLSLKGVDVWWDGKQLRYSAGAVVLSPFDRQRAEDLRGDIIDLLSAKMPQPRGSLPIKARSVQNRAVASFAQQRLWFLAQMNGASEAYHIPLALHLRGRLDKAALVQAVDRLVARHEGLRTTFVTIEGEVFQQIQPAEVGFELKTIPVVRSDDLKQEVTRRIAAEASCAFDLEAGPLIRGQLLQLGVDENILLITMHHIVSDGWSLAILTRDLDRLYHAASNNEPCSLEPLPIQYADYAGWQRQWSSAEVLSQQIGYWRRQLVDVPVLMDLPLDRKRPEQQDFIGGFVQIDLDSELTSNLKGLSQGCGATLFMTLLAGWATVLARLCGQQDVVIGTPVANRAQPEVEELIGLFVNTLALRVSLEGSPSVKDLIERVKTVAIGAQDNQDLPFEQIVDLIKPARSLSYSPLFQVMFAWQEQAVTPIEFLGTEYKTLATPMRHAKFDLTLDLTDLGERLVGGIEYSSALFDHETVERFAGYLKRILAEMAADPNGVALKLPMLGSAERHQLLVEWNATEADYPKQACVHELFEAQAARSPESTAVVYEDQSLSYGELNTQANRLAHHLRGLGVRPDSRVAICVERSPEMVVGLMAILKAGGAYVPLDPAYPAERLGYMLQDSAPVLVLTHAAARGALSQAMAGLAEAPPVVDLDGTAWSQACPDNLDPAAIGLNSAHLAYVIYTSGSTGTPKGVMVEHRGVVNRLSWMQSAYSLTADVKVLQKTPFTFDVSVWELFWTLGVGAELIVAKADSHKEIPELINTIEALNVSTVHFVPSMLGVFLEKLECARCLSIKRVFCSGEALSESLLKKFHKNLKSASIHNLYGPTEATVDVTYWNSCESKEISGAPPIGRPISNTRIYLLDGHGEPVPRGVAGEIHIGGAGVARGYLNRAELTAERFIASPFVPGDRLYKTGDLGRYLPDGNIEFLGRNDFQVKVRGFRIELGEIEARLLEHEGVHEAAVLAREDASGDKRLAAYYVAEEGGDEVGAEALRSHLAVRLPDYMVPAAYVRLSRLPLTPNGKLDRKALPAPDGEAYATRSYEAPQGEVEETLARIWSEVLGLERVGRHDNFFDLGGHSLLAVRVLERMRREGLRGDVRALFGAPTLSALAATVSWEADTVAVPANGIEAGCERITPQMLPLVELSQDEIDRVVATVAGGVGNVQDIYPLAPLQEGILFHHLLAKEGDPYLLWSLMSFSDRSRLDAYVAALEAVIARHDILRTAVVWEGLREPVQVVWRRAPLVVEEVWVEPSAGDVAEHLRQRFDPRSYRLDVRRAPLMQLMIAHDPSNDRWVAISLIHHLVDDNTSLRQTSDEIGVHLVGNQAALPAPLPFRNFVAQSRLGVSAAEHEAFFGRMLGDVEEPTAPFGLLDVLGDGSEVLEAQVSLEEALSQRLRRRARALKVSAASLFHVAWAQVLARTSGREDPVFGTVLFGRMQGGEGADRALGLFINTLPVRLRLGVVGAQACVEAAHRTLTELLRHEHASLVLAQRCSSVPAPAPLFTAFLNYRHSATVDHERHPDQEAWSGIEFLGGEERTNYPLTLSVDDFGEGFWLTAQASGGVEPERVCAMMVRALEGLVEALEAEPEREMRRVDVLPAAERHQLLVEWNATEADYPKQACVHELFEAQAARSPESTAVVYEDQSLSYGELNTQANRLAHHLRGLGVRPDSRVAICVERSPEMVVGLMAILKAGGAYVPLDPAYPAERLGYMLQDSAPVLVLTHAAARGALSQAMAGLAEAPPVVDLDGTAWSQACPDNLDPAAIGLNSAHLAYVIYTSGSTGTPKGVCLHHLPLVNLLHWQARAKLSRNMSKVLQFCSVNFDVAFQDLLMEPCVLEVSCALSANPTS